MDPVPEVHPVGTDTAVEPALESSAEAVRFGKSYSDLGLRFFHQKQLKLPRLWFSSRQMPRFSRSFATFVSVLGNSV